MSIVHVEATGQESLDKATKLLAGIPGGVDKAVKGAMSRAVSRVRTASTKAIQERYAISATNIRANENIQVRYSYQDGVQAVVMFSGHKIPLFRYDAAAPKVPTRDTGTWVRAMTGSGWRVVHPSIPASGHQLKGTSPTRFNDAFTARMKSGHTGIFERTGGITTSGREEIRELMGSSVPQMLGNQHAEETMAQEALDAFDKRMDHEILRVLNGW